MANLQKKKMVEKRYRRERAHQRLRPRLAVFKSDRYLYAQVIDDDHGKTLVAAASLEPELKSALGAAAANKSAAKLVGEKLAERALAQGIKRVVFDRGGYRYHGKVKELADAARAKGLEF
jgi:large subunit ribosomal protein L18